MLHFLFHFLLWLERKEREGAHQIKNIKTKNFHLPTRVSVYKCVIGHRFPIDAYIHRWFFGAKEFGALCALSFRFQPPKQQNGKSFGATSKERSFGKFLMDTLKLSNNSNFCLRLNNVYVCIVFVLNIGKIWEEQHNFNRNEWIWFFFIIDCKWFPRMFDVLCRWNFRI